LRVETFSPPHLAIVATVPLAAWGLARLARRGPRALRRVRLALAAAIALDALLWYAVAASRGEIAPPHGLPLDLCDVVLFVVVVALAAPRPWALEAAYYLGLGGSGMALLTPDVGEGASAAAVVQFFAAHGAVVGSVLFLAFAGALRPRPGSWWRVFLAVNAYAAAVLAFDLAFGTNYMYLREKPAAGTLLDLLGPWPWYVLAADAVALALLWLLHLPFRGSVEDRPPRAAGPWGGR
jgi:hypothetical integral membrane protein (TIGR02206 family)